MYNYVCDYTIYDEKNLPLRETEKVLPFCLLPLLLDSHLVI